MSGIFVETLLLYSRSILPWIFLGIILAYFAEKFIKPKTVRRYVGAYSMRKAMSAILLGMVSPLSIMSFLPVAREFVDLGANPGMLFIFLIAERAYDLQSFFILSALFGLRFTTLNAVAIFLSLLATALFLRDQKIRFRVRKAKKHTFWYQQVRLLLIVLFGILLSSVIRASIPQTVFQQYTGNTAGGLISASLAGFLIYIGPIIANYPIAKAFLDLGMVKIGVFAFLTVFPVINGVIYLLFGGVVGYRTITKAFIVYGIASLLLTVFYSFLL